jgi:hypothetical protein
MTQNYTHQTKLPQLRNSPTRGEIGSFNLGARTSKIGESRDDG